MSDILKRIDFLCTTLCLLGNHSAMCIIFHTTLELVRQVGKVVGYGDIVNPFFEVTGKE